MDHIQWRGKKKLKYHIKGCAKIIQYIEIKADDLTHLHLKEKHIPNHHNKGTTNYEKYRYTFVNLDNSISTGHLLYSSSTDFPL